MGHGLFDGRAKRRHFVGKLRSRQCRVHRCHSTADVDTDGSRNDGFARRDDTSHGGPKPCAPQKVNPALIARFRPAAIGLLPYPSCAKNSDSHDIPKRRPTALGDVANTDTKLLICSLFQKEPSFGTGRGYTRHESLNEGRGINPGDTWRPTGTTNELGFAQRRPGPAIHRGGTWAVERFRREAPSPSR